jgi:2-iminobutanoate/2-iminopropanoate deaminase
MKQILASSEIPSSPFYNQGIKVDSTIYISGMIAFDPVTKKVEAKSIEEQTEQAIRNCEKILHLGGASLDDVIQVIVLLRNPEDFEGMNRAYQKVFSKNPPTRAVAKLGVEVPNVLISILMTAAT